MNPEQMTPDPDLSRAVRSWLADGADRLPERVLDAVLDAVPSTTQRRSWWPPRRTNSMQNPVRLVAVAAAVIVAGVVGIRLLPAGGIGAPTPTPSPTQRPSPSPVPDAVLNASLTAGTYRVGAPFRFPFTITFTADWTPKTLNTSDTQFKKTLPDVAAPWIVVDVPDNVYTDPCHTAGGTPAPPVAATVDGLVNALTHMTGFEAGAVSDARINGRFGKTFVLTNTINTDTANCTGGTMLPMWTFPGGASGTNGGATEQIWVLDVNGTPVVIDGESFPETLPADRQLLQPTIQSIAFE